VFLYDDTLETHTQILRILEGYAADPELDFSWYDAAFLSQKVRNLAEKTMAHPSIEQEISKGRILPWPEGGSQ